MTDFDLIKTPTVDNLLKENGLWVANIESSNMTEGEKEEMRIRGEVLDQELDEIQTIQSELLGLIQEAGYDIKEIKEKISKVL